MAARCSAVKHPLNDFPPSRCRHKAQGEDHRPCQCGDTTNSIKQARVGIVAAARRKGMRCSSPTCPVGLNVRAAYRDVLLHMNDQTRAFTKRFNELYSMQPPTMVQAGVYS
jgi:branched-chain amino acid transport system substrate-binding protein